MTTKAVHHDIFSQGPRGCFGVKISPSKMHGKILKPLYLRIGASKSQKDQKFSFRQKRLTHREPFRNTTTVMSHHLGNYRKGLDQHHPTSVTSDHVNATIEIL